MKNVSDKSHSTWTYPLADYWEGGPPTEQADRQSNSLPIYFNKLHAQRVCVGIHDADKYVKLSAYFYWLALLMIE